MHYENYLRMLLLKMSVELCDLSQYSNEEKRKLFRDLIALAENSYDLTNIADHVVYALGDKELASEIYRKAFAIADAAEYHNIACSVKFYLEDSNWAARIFSEAEKNLNSAVDLLMLSSAVLKCMNDKSWAVKLLQKAFNNASGFNDWLMMYYINKSTFQEQSFSSRIINKIKVSAATPHELFITAELLSEEGEDVNVLISFFSKALEQAAENRDFAAAAEGLKILFAARKMYKDLAVDYIYHCFRIAANTAESNEQYVLLLKLLALYFNDNIEIAESSPQNPYDEYLDLTDINSNANFEQEQKLRLRFKNKLWSKTLLAETNGRIPLKDKSNYPYRLLSEILRTHPDIYEFVP